MRIADRLDPGRAIMLYGAGQLAAMALDLWPRALARPVLLIDEYSTRPEVCGIPVRPLASVAEDQLRGAQIILSAFKADVFEITRLLAERDLSIALTVYDIFERYIPDRFSNGWRLPDPSPGFDDSLRRAQALFADARSRQTYDDVIAWRRSREIAPDIYERIEGESTKYVNDLTRSAIAQSNLIIDGGSYDGGFLIACSSLGPADSTMVAFEPDPTSMERTHRALRAAGLDGRTALCPQALHARPGQFEFFATGGLSARIVEDGSGNCRVSAVALDDFLPPWIAERQLRVRSPVLKLHIEGAELQALQGAAHFVRQFKPLVMVNGSHNSDGVLRIPQLLRDLGCVRLYMRSHAIFGEGVTFYAL